MSLLEKIRDYHDDPDNFEEFKVYGNLLDVEVQAMIERYYAKFLSTQIRYFPYMLKSQWREMWGRSRKTGHYALTRLIDAKVLGEGEFRGCHYVYPITRAMKWYTRDPKALPMRSSVSPGLLMDSFMRAEYFLRVGDPLFARAEEALAEFEGILKGVPKEVVEKMLPPISLFENKRKWEERFGVDDQEEQVEAAFQVLERMKRALIGMARRNCYVKKIEVMWGSSLEMELMAIQIGPPSEERVLRLMEDASLICEIFETGSFLLTIVADGEKVAGRYCRILENTYERRVRFEGRTRCKGVRVIDLNISRYFQDSYCFTDCKNG